MKSLRLCLKEKVKQMKMKSYIECFFVVPSVVDITSIRRFNWDLNFIVTVSPLTKLVRLDRLGSIDCRRIFFGTALEINSLLLRLSEEGPALTVLSSPGELSDENIWTTKSFLLDNIKFFISKGRVSRFLSVKRDTLIINTT